MSTETDAIISWHESNGKYIIADGIKTFYLDMGHMSYCVLHSRRPCLIFPLSQSSTATTVTTSTPFEQNPGYAQ